MAKESLYRTFVARMEASLAAQMYLEASWYAYAVLEDRLVSLLRNSGGLAGAVRMMGPKLKELSRRAKYDALLAANFEENRLDAWREARNELMHAMADATMSIAEIDAGARDLAIEGAALVREYAAACRRLKKHRNKV